MIRTACTVCTAFLIIHLIAVPSVLGQDFPALQVDGALGPVAEDTGGGKHVHANMEVRLEDPTGSAIFHAEVQCGVDVIGRDGLFTVLLGTDPGNPLEDDFSENRWIGITACLDRDGCDAPTAADPGACDEPILLRFPLHATGYAYRARTADELSGPIDHDDLINVQSSQHHVRYDDTEAVAAMGPVANGNTLNHDRYTDAEAQAANDARFLVLEAQVAALESLLQHFSRVDDDVFITGANLHVRNGLGQTNTANGTGNLIVGYNELRGDTDGDGIPDDDRSGSHFVVAGRRNNFEQWGGFVSGQDNDVNAPWASIVGGSENVADGAFSVLVGGLDNQASGSHSAVVSGRSNFAGGHRSAVLGGRFNEATSLRSTVTGGVSNVASGSNSSVSGGFGNEASGNHASVGGGASNLASGNRASVSGGYMNQAVTEDASISGGRENMASDLTSTGTEHHAPWVGGGFRNHASGLQAAVVAGRDNVASGSRAAVLGGANGEASGNMSAIGAGNGGVASGDFSAVVGGNNGIASGPRAVVVSGGSNEASGINAAVLGGNDNLASGNNAVVAGGTQGTASGSVSAILGGRQGDASGLRATIGGGLRNVAADENATVSGGRDNTAAGRHSAVSGGANRTAPDINDWVAGTLFEDD